MGPKNQNCLIKIKRNWLLEYFEHAKFDSDVHFFCLGKFGPKNQN